MGGSASRATTTVRNEILQDFIASCGVQSCENVDEGSTIVFKPGSRVNNLNLSQKCKVEADCVLDAAIQTASDAIAGADAKAKQGLFGVALGDTNVDIETKIKQHLEASCPAMSSENIRRNQLLIFSKDSNVSNIDLSQIGDIGMKCRLNIMAGAVAKARGQAKTAALGFDPTGSIGLIVIILVVGFLVFSSLKGAFRSK